MRRSIPGKVKKESDFMKEAKEALEKQYQMSQNSIEPMIHQTVPRMLPNGGWVPSKCSPDMAEEIITRISHGETFHSIAKDPRMPTAATMWNWVRKIPKFAEVYYEAKQFAMEVMSEDILNIADDASTDLQSAIDHKTGEFKAEVNFEAIRRSELRVKTRQWLMERLMPKRFNEKSAVESATMALSAKTMEGAATIQILLPNNGRQIIDVSGKS